MKRIGVVTFPGSNCDLDCREALSAVSLEPVSLWHRDRSLQGCEAVLLPGGFSYGDYLRCGAIARFSPIMSEIRRFANEGGLVIGICNGFQILTEAGLLPGALLLNHDRRFICRFVTVRVERTDHPWTQQCGEGRVLALPIAHADGRYWTSTAQLEEMEAHRQILLRYCTDNGQISDAANPNGSIDNIAGICNANGNVIGIMPHPERAMAPLLGSGDGRCLFESLLSMPMRGRAAPDRSAVHLSPLRPIVTS